MLMKSKKRTTVCSWTEWNTSVKALFHYLNGSKSHENKTKGV